MRHFNVEVAVPYKTKLGEVNTTFFAIIDHLINKNIWKLCLTLTMQQWGS